MEKKIVYNITKCENPVVGNVIIVGKGQKQISVPLEAVRFRGQSLADYLSESEQILTAKFEAAINELKARISACENKQNGNEVL